MNCPKCGAPVQPYDRFCIRCGHDMQPDSAAEPAQTTATYNPVQGVGAQATPTYTAQSPFGGATPQQPYGAPARNSGPNGGAWASGSSTPGPNSYASTPSTVSNGTMLNGRSANNGQGRGLLQGIGAAIVAGFVILGKIGGGIAAIGFFKFLFYWWLFSGLLHAGLGTLVLVVVVLLIIGGVARSRGMV